MSTLTLGVTLVSGGKIRGVSPAPPSGDTLGLEDGNELGTEDGNTLGIEQ